MDNISYFKLQAKNLYRDFKLAFVDEDEAYDFSPRFFDINAIVSDFEIDTDDFSLMKAQHILARLVGFMSWDELIKSSDKVLEQKKDILEHLSVKVKKSKVYHIDLSPYEKIQKGHLGDYLLKCPRLKELEEIITLKPNCYFMSVGGEKEVKEFQNDTKHIYVNVFPRSNTKSCTIRVLVPDAVYPDYYAVSVKNVSRDSETGE